MFLAALYYLMVAALFTHELDAVKRHEWRVLPLTRLMSERAGEQVFIWIHVPLFAIILWLGEGSIANGFRYGLSGFAVIHVGLHWLYRHHPAYEFNNWNSWSLILLTGVSGAVYLVCASV